jgi:hypothetical protein
VVGAALTAITLTLAGPSLFGEKMVRDALLSNPQMLFEASDAIRDSKYA